MSKSKLFLLLLFSTTIAYGLSVFYGFSQDDWFHLSISRASNIGEFFNFFNPFTVNWIFFRPLSTQLPYWLSSTLFSLYDAPEFLHVVMLLIHSINAYLVVLISRKYLKASTSNLLGIIYAISNIHFLSLFYIGAIQQLISTLFSLLAILFFIKRPKGSQMILGALTLCALLSKELAIRLPMILFALSLIEERNIVKSIKAVMSPMFVTIIYFAIRYFSGSSGATEYEIVWSLGTTLATTMWYVLFSLGFPEEILRYGLSGGMIDFGRFIMVNPIARIPIILGAILLAIYICYQVFLTIKIKRNWYVLSYPLIALLSLAPIIFLPTHRYPHYLDLFILFMGIWLLRNIEKINIKVFFITSIIGIGMIASIGVEMSTHWTIKRARIAKRVETVLIASGDCHTIKGLAFVGQGKEPLEISYAMSLMNGPRIICNNPGLQVYYFSDKVPNEFGSARVFKTEGLIP